MSGLAILLAYTLHISCYFFVLQCRLHQHLVPLESSFNCLTATPARYPCCRSHTWSSPHIPAVPSSMTYIQPPRTIVYIGSVFPVRLRQWKCPVRTLKPEPGTKPRLFTDKRASLETAPLILRTYPSTCLRSKAATVQVCSTLQRQKNSYY